MSQKNVGRKSLIKESAESTQKYNSIFYDKNGNIVLRILAKPGAKCNGIIDMSDEGIGVQINAPPVDGEANTELLKYLSGILGVRKSDLSLDRGSKSRQKTVLVRAGTHTIDVIQAKFENLI